ncbi:16433_t:CDS:2, partial [Funneliformis caledonium]
MPLTHSDSFEELYNRSADILSKVANFALLTAADSSIRNDNANKSKISLDITNPEDREMFTLTRLGRSLGYIYLENNKKNSRCLRNLIEHFKIKRQEKSVSWLPSKLLLVEAGFFLIEDKGNLVKVLKMFNDSLKKGIVKPVLREELVVQLILILVVRYLKKRWFSFSIILRDFVQLFYLDNEQALKYILNGRVAFTHFVSVDYVSNKEELKGYYHCYIAIIFKLNQQAADLMILILLANWHPYVSADKKYPSLTKIRPKQIFTSENLENYSEEYLSIYWLLRYT